MLHLLTLYYISLMWCRGSDLMLALAWLRASAVQPLTPAPPHTHCSGRWRRHGWGCMALSTRHMMALSWAMTHCKRLPLWLITLCCSASCGVWADKKTKNKNKPGLRTWNTRRSQPRLLSISGAIPESCKTRGFQANEICKCPGLTLHLNKLLVLVGVGLGVFSWVKIFRAACNLEKWADIRSTKRLRG